MVVLEAVGLAAVGVGDAEVHVAADAEERRLALDVADVVAVLAPPRAGAGPLDACRPVVPPLDGVPLTRHAVSLLVEPPLRHRHRDPIGREVRQIGPPPLPHVRTNELLALADDGGGRGGRVLTRGHSAVCRREGDVHHRCRRFGLDGISRCLGVGKSLDLIGTRQQQRQPARLTVVPSHRRCGLAVRRFLFPLPPSRGGSLLSLCLGVWVCARGGRVSSLLAHGAAVGHVRY